MTVPYWVQDAIFYQIFPDRFANGNLKNDPPNVQPWGSQPTTWNFMGGDLRGIIQKLDYLLDLGVSAIYLNPIFQSPSNHRYNTTDYFRIDPKLGTMDDFQALLKVAHSNDIRVILDGVFNHCGRGFFAFNDILENQENSPFVDWFHINRFPVKAYSPGESEDYVGWWGNRSLPKFNTDNPEVRRYLHGVARYWIEQGADGWRLDVPNEINDDKFWKEFREIVKSVNYDAYLVGEIWMPDPRWVDESHFDGLMNYPMRDALIELLNGKTIKVSEFAEKIEDLLSLYPRDNVYAMYLPLSTHDTERLLTILDGNLDKVKLAFLFQFAYPGAPAVYYGDEVGMQGEKDPASRGAFPWDIDQQNEELHAWVRTLASLRKRWKVLRRGDYQRLFVDDRRGIYAFTRSLGSETILIVMNASPSRRYLRLPITRLKWNDGRILHNLLGKEEYLVSGDTLLLSLSPWVGVWIG
jgi:cyclomaltodextrinase